MSVRYFLTEKLNGFLLCNNTQHEYVQQILWLRSKCQLCHPRTVMKVMRYIDNALGSQQATDPLTAHLNSGRDDRCDHFPAKKFHNNNHHLSLQSVFVLLKSLSFENIPPSAM